MAVLTTDFGPSLSPATIVLAVGACAVAKIWPTGADTAATVVAVFVAAVSLMGLAGRRLRSPGWRRLDLVAFACAMTTVSAVTFFSLGQALV